MQVKSLQPLHCGRAALTAELRRPGVRCPSVQQRHVIAKATPTEGTRKYKKNDIEAVSLNGLAERLAAKCQLSVISAKEIADNLFQLIEEEIASGKKVSVSGFATFEPRARAARKARNPRTGEEISVPSTVVPYFIPSKKFKDRVTQSLAGRQNAKNGTGN